MPGYCLYIIIAIRNLGAIIAIYFIYYKWGFAFITIYYHLFHLLLGQLVDECWSVWFWYLPSWLQYNCRGVIDCVQICCHRNGFKGQSHLFYAVSRKGISAGCNDIADYCFMLSYLPQLESVMNLKMKLEWKVAGSHNCLSNWPTVQWFSIRQTVSAILSHFIEKKYRGHWKLDDHHGQYPTSSSGARESFVMIQATLH